MDLVRAIVADRRKFADTIFTSKLSKETKIKLLRLAKRSKRELILDIVCQYFKNRYGAAPLKHDNKEVPKQFLPREFEKWYLGILKETI